MLIKHLLVETTSDERIDYNRLMEVFRKDTDVTHKDVNELANQFGVSVEAMQLKIYNILGDVLRNIGKHNDVPDSEFDSNELTIGIKEEMEHTKDPNIAKMIAKDHLKENPHYYSKLKKAKLTDS